MGGQDVRQRFLAGFLMVLVVAGIGWQLLNWWTRPTAVEFDNLKYIQLLTTAVSSRQMSMVNQVKESITKRFESQQMSEREFAHFQNLMLLAQNGQWEQADRECFEFAEAQLNRSRTQAAQAHSHSHDGVDSHPHADH